MKVKLEFWRLEKGLELRELSDKTEISISELKRLESGKGRITTKQSFVLSRVLGITIDELVYGELKNNQKR